MRKTILFIFMSVSICSFAFAEQLTITTYYPAPFGVYRDLTTETLTVLNNGEQVSIGDSNNASIELRHISGGGNTPYIDFTNDSSNDYDYRFILNSNNAFSIRGGTTRFSRNNGTPAAVKVKEVWYCVGY